MPRARIPCPPIVVYKALDEAPAGHEFIAFHFLQGTVKHKDGRPDRTVYGRLPVFINASTEDAAAERAHQWWESEQDRLDSVQAKYDAAGARLRKKETDNVTS